MREMIRIGSGSGFWGDALDPAIELLEHGDLDYMGLDYLAELTMALLQRQKDKDASRGFVPDVVAHMEQLLPIARRKGTKIICNAGGSNPRAAGAAVVRMARAAGLGGTRVATLEGDDILDRVAGWVDAGMDLTNLETGDTDIAAIIDRIASANVYTGAEGIIAALAQGADIVIGGRVSDSALYIGPIMHEFGWTYEPKDVDLVGAAATIGHIIECAAGCTGGMSSRWAEMDRMGEVGFPLVEMSADGTAVIGKVEGTGGRVDEWTIKEHLVYETLDPGSYITPDVVADFTTLRLTEDGADRVKVHGMSGRPRPDRLKAIIGYEDGWIGEGTLFFPWPDALGRAQKARQTMSERLDRLGLRPDDIHIDFVGVNMLHGPAAPMPAAELNEVGLRVAVRTKSRSQADLVRRACSQLWIMGPGGTSFGAPLKPRPVLSIWPTLIPRELVAQSVTIEEV